MLNDGLMELKGLLCTTFERKEGKSIDLDDGVRITVLNIKKDKVRLEIVAPPSMGIIKSEHSKVEFVRVH